MKYSKRLARYCNQTAKLERQTQPDGYGNMQYASPIEIQVRREGKSRLVRDTNGETVTSDTTIFSLVEISPLDKVDGKEVIDAMMMVDHPGKIIGWEAYL